MMQLYTTFSLPFMIYRNPTRGAQTAVARTGVKAVGKVGAIEAWDLLKALSTGGAQQPGLAARMALNYAEAAFGGELMPEVRDLVEQQILLPPRISSAMVRDIENLTELLSDGGILAFQIEQAKAGKWPWWKKFAPTRESIKFAERVFTAYEAFEKIVNYQAAQGRGLSDDTAKAIARRAGIPKPGVGGSATMPMEVLFPFLRVTIQGYRASLETLQDPEVGKGYATRVAAFSFAPRIFKIGIGMGVAAGLIKWMMHPDEDEEDPVMAEVMRRVNPYKMALDNTFPLMLYDSRTGKYHYFWDFKSGKSIPSHFEVVSLRIPDSEEGRTWGPLLYNLLTSMPKVEVGQNTKEGWQKAFEIPSVSEKMGRPGENPVTAIARWAVNEATPSRSPVFEVSGNLFSMTFKGENPPDEFRGGQPSANKMLFDAGWGEGRGEAILGYTLNQLGFAGDVASTMMMNMGMLDQKASSALKQRLASDKTPLIERIPALKSAFSYDNYASYRDEESARLEEVKIRARLRANLPPEVKEIYDFYWKNYKRQEKLDVIDRLKFNVSKDLMNGWGKINDPTSMFSTIGHAFGKDGSKMARDSAIEHIERLAAPKVAKWKMIIDMQSE
jgi:hypothetical protein